MRAFAAAREPKKGTVFGEWTYDHPQFDTEALAAQQMLPEIQGHGHIWFAGAWTGYGFHEDGLRSGLEAAEALDLVGREKVSMVLAWPHQWAQLVGAPNWETADLSSLIYIDKDTPSCRRNCRRGPGRHR